MARKKKKRTVKRAKKTRNSGKKNTPAETAKPITPAQEAHRITWLILGELKSTQIKYLRVGMLLCDVRDRKLYGSLKYADMESYAWARLHLRRTAYYQYVQVYDWVAASHKEWLEPHPKGFIPDLNDVTDLIQIEKKLKESDLDPAVRKSLEALRKKALTGQLKFGELDKFLRHGNEARESMKAMLSRVRSVRNYAKKLTAMPAEALAHLNAAVELIEKAYKEEDPSK